MPLPPETSVCICWDGERVRALSYNGTNFVRNSVDVLPEMCRQPAVPFNVTFPGKIVKEYVYPSGTTALGMAVTTDPPNLFDRQTILVPGFWLDKEGNEINRTIFGGMLESSAVPFDQDLPSFNPPVEIILDYMAKVAEYAQDDRFLYVLRDTDRCQIGILIADWEGLYPIHSMPAAWEPA